MSVACAELANVLFYIPFFFVSLKRYRCRSCSLSRLPMQRKPLALNLNVRIISFSLQGQGLGDEHKMIFF